MARVLAEFTRCSGESSPNRETARGWSWLSRYSEFQPVPGFYRVSNMVQVTIRDLTKVSDVIDTAVKAGANNVWGISFSLDDTDALEAQAREKAVADAKARAESLASLTGVKVGQVMAVSEVVGGSSVPMFASADRAMGLGGGGTPAEPGEVTFSTQIQVIYAIQ